MRALQQGTFLTMTGCSSSFSLTRSALYTVPKPPAASFLPSRNESCSTSSIKQTYHQATPLHKLQSACKLGNDLVVRRRVGKPLILVEDVVVPGALQHTCKARILSRVQACSTSSQGSDNVTHLAAGSGR